MLGIDEQTKENVFRKLSESLCEEELMDNLFENVITTEHFNLEFSQNKIDFS